MSWAKLTLATAVALGAGWILGRVLFPPPVAAVAPAAATLAERGGQRAASVLTAAGSRRSEAERSARAALDHLVAARRSANPHRAELESTLRLRAMGEAEVRALAEAIAEGGRAFTRYETGYLTAVWRRLAKTAPESAIQLGLSLTNRDLKRATTKAAVDVWSQRDPRAALEFLLDAEQRWFIDGRDIALGHLAARDPGAAVEVLERVRASDWFPIARQSVFDAWRQTDAGAARAWILRELDGDPAAAVGVFAQADPASAIGFARAHPPDPALRRAVNDTIVSRWMRSDRAAALQAFGDLPEDWLDNAALRNFGLNAAHSLSADELDTVRARLPNDALRDALARGMIDRAATGGRFADATAQLAGIAGDEARAAAAASIAAEWTRASPAETSEWLSTLEIGAVRDQAVARFAQTLEPAEPASARTWAETISDVDLRARTLRTLGGDGSGR